ncbi:MAG: hypothetical protein ACT4P4_08650, partial [Betaproteobacteria bacterium]
MPAPPSMTPAETACRCRERRTVERPGKGPARALLLVASAANDATFPTHWLALRMQHALRQARLECDRLDLSVCDAGKARQRCRAAQALVLIARAPCPHAAALFERIAAPFSAGAACGRAYGLLLHGPIDAVEVSRRTLSERLDRAGWIDAGAQARLDSFVGYEQPSMLHDGPGAGDRPRSAEADFLA